MSNLLNEPPTTVHLSTAGGRTLCHHGRLLVNKPPLTNNPEAVTCKQCKDLIAHRAEVALKKAQRPEPSLEPPEVTARQRELLAEMLKPGARPEVVIPADAKPEDLLKTLEACATGIRALRHRLDLLKPMLGRVLLVFEEKPSLYKNLGHQRFEDFLRDRVGLVLGIGRTVLYESMTLARKWPQVTAEQYAKIGSERMQILSHFASGSDANAEKLLAMAPTKTVYQLRQWAEEKGLVNVGETVRRTIVIHTTEEIHDAWGRFCALPEIQAKLGTADHGRILQTMMQECAVEWFREGIAIIADKQEKEQHHETEE